MGKVKVMCHVRVCGDEKCEVCVASDSDLEWPAEVAVRCCPCRQSRWFEVTGAWGHLGVGSSPELVCRRTLAFVDFWGTSCVVVERARILSLSTAKRPV